MSWLLLSIVVLSGQSDASAGGELRDAAEATPRRLADINRLMLEAIQADANAQTDSQRLDAVRQMAQVYREILDDPRFASSDTLKSYRARLWSRMTRIKQDAERRLARSERQQADALDLQQQQALEAATRSLSEQMTLMSHTMGGPSYVFQQGGGAMGGAAVQDHGQQLIDLIQRTIRPQFWDTNGGPGSMFYYRPLMALVVSATSEVHGNVGGLLDALRRVGQ
jgi:hypothetical protein